MTREFNFTGMRVGRRVAPFDRKIIICPKCGKRGTDDFTKWPSNGKPGWRSVTHRGYLTDVAGVPFFRNDEWCCITIPVEAVR